MNQLSIKRSAAYRPQVIIIGASAAGLFAACLLAKGGVPVYLFDEQEKLGWPARTLIVTSSINDVLESVPTEAVVNRVYNLQLFSPGQSVAIRLSKPDWIVERGKLIQMLASQAKAAGVEVLLGYRFLGLEPDQRDLAIHLETCAGRMEHVRTRVLIGADGVSSQVARATGQDGHSTVFVLQATVDLPPSARLDTTQVWFDPQTTCYFYWLIPESPGRAVAGLVGTDERQARGGLERFLSIQNLEALGYQGAEVPLYSRNLWPWKKVAGAHVFLVGDAAAQVKGTTVGGVVAGLLGARAAARAILQGGNYHQELAALRKELELHLLVRKALNRFAPSDYDELLSLVNARAQRVLGTRTRDEIRRVLFLSLLVQPKLLLLAARRFLWPGSIPPT